SDCAFLELAPLTLRQSAPDAEALVVLQGVLQAFGTDFAGEAHPLRLPGRSTLFGKERLGVRLRAQCALLPHKLGVPVYEHISPCHGIASSTLDPDELAALPKGETFAELTKRHGWNYMPV